MIEVTKDQIKETLERLRDYAHWMYYSKGIKEKFESQTRKVNGRIYSIKLLDNGNYKLMDLDSDDWAIYKPMIITRPLRGEMDNLDYKLRRVEYNGDKEILDRVAIFILSAFQRAACLLFFARIMISE